MHLRPVCLSADRQADKLRHAAGLPSASSTEAADLPPTNSPSSSLLYVSLSHTHTHLQAPADRPLDEGEFLQLLQRAAQHAGRAQGHPAG